MLLDSLVFVVNAPGRPIFLKLLLQMMDDCCDDDEERRIQGLALSSPALFSPSNAVGCMMDMKIT